MALSRILLFALVCTNFCVVVSAMWPGSRRPWHRNKGMHKGMHPVVQRLLESEPRMRTRNHRRDMGRDLVRRFKFGLDMDLDVDSSTGSRFYFTLDIDDNWWKGPNVCREIKKDVTNITQSHSSGVTRSIQCVLYKTERQCKYRIETPMRRETRTTTYRCCYGFQREKGKIGCTKELKLKPLVTTLRELNSTKQLMKALDSVRLTSTLKESNFTVFAPSEDAFNRFLPRRKVSTEVVEVNEKAMEEMTKLLDVLASHVVSGLHPSSNLAPEQILQTQNPGGTIRIGRYDKGFLQVTTANCVPLSSEDNLATNGVVHVVGKVLVPVGGYTLFDLVSRNPQLTVLKKVLGRSDVSGLLKKEGSYTFFAPSDAAFAKLSPLFTNAVMKGDECSKNILKHHLLPLTLCSAAIANNTLPTLLANQVWPSTLVKVTRTEDGKYFVGGKQIVVADVMAANGVMHIIDDVIMPDGAMGPLHIAERLGATQFVNFVKRAGLYKDFHNLRNVTIFLPTNEAFEKLPQAVLDDLSKNPGELAKILKYHIATVVQEYTTRPWEPLSTLQSNKKIRFNQGSKKAQCAGLVKKDVNFCGGLIHVIDQVMTPPGGDLLDTLAENNQFSLFIDLLKKSGLAPTLQKEGPFTVLAPSNKAIQRIDREYYRYLTNDQAALKEYLKKHVQNDFQCCSEFRRTPFLFHKFPFMRTRQSNGRTMVNGVPLKECDIIATNGVIHGFDSPVFSPPRRRQPQRSFLDKFDLSFLDSLFDEHFFYKKK